MSCVDSVVLVQEVFSFGVLRQGTNLSLLRHKDRRHFGWDFWGRYIPDCGFRSCRPLGSYRAVGDIFAPKISTLPVNASSASAQEVSAPALLDVDDVRGIQCQQGHNDTRCNPRCVSESVHSNGDDVKPEKDATTQDPLSQTFPTLDMRQKYY